MHVEVRVLSDTGLRPHNEDSYFTPPLGQADLLDKKGRLFIVADGVGGHSFGEVASQMAVDGVAKSYYNDPNSDLRVSLQQAIDTANEQIYEAAELSRKPRGMSTTIVAAILKGDELTVANVGDSRAYLYHGKQLTQLSIDHTWVNKQLKAGLITTEQARNHHQKHIVLRSLGQKEKPKIDFSMTYSVQVGDRVLLCTDGLTDVVEEHDILAIIANQSAQLAANSLIQLALERKSPDNVTALVIELSGGPSPKSSSSTTTDLSLSLVAPQTMLTVPPMAKVSPTRHGHPPTSQRSKSTLVMVMTTVGSVIVGLLVCAFMIGFLFTDIPTDEPPLKSAPLVIETLETFVEPIATLAVGTADPLIAETVTVQLTDVISPTVLPTFQNEAPTLVYPPEGATVALNDIRSKAGLALRWQGTLLSDQARFVVYLRDAAGKIVPLPDNGITQQTDYLIPQSLLQPGQYSWLVTVEDYLADKFQAVTRSKAGLLAIQPPPPIDTQPTATSPTVIDLSELQLLRPHDDTTLFTNQTVVFEWTWEGQLPDGYQFEVRIWLEGQPHYGAYDVNEMTIGQQGSRFEAAFELDGAESIRKFSSQENYYWAVGVVKINPYRRLEGVESPSQRIIVTVSGETNQDEGD